MKTLRNMVATLIIAMVLLSLSPVMASSMALQYVAAQSVNASNTSIEYAKAQVLLAMLTNALTLNISDALRNEIQSLLTVNISSLSSVELKEWIRNASNLLSQIASEVREGRAYKVGIVLERYLNGLKIALENRFRVHVRHYNVSINIDEIIANATRARDVNHLFKMYRNAAREIEAKKAERFAEVVRKRISNDITAVIGGEVRGLEKVAIDLEKSLNVLNKTIEKLRVMNASENIIKALEEAEEHVRLAKRIVANISAEVAAMIQIREMERIRERVREAFNKSIEMLIEIANRTIGEILEELNQLRDRALDANLTDIVERIDNLTIVVSEIRGKLQAVNTTQDVHTILSKLAKVRIAVKTIEKEIEMTVGEIGKKLGVKIEELARKAISEAKEKLKKVNNKFTEIKEAIKNIVCIAIYPPPPACMAIKNIEEKLIPLIEEKINEAKNLIEKAEESYGNGRYTEALAYASKALGILNSIEHQLNSIQKLSEVPQHREGPRR
ncbi:MAG: hypothetical protein QW438_03750 [Ignisphaera sp.]